MLVQGFKERKECFDLKERGQLLYRISYSLFHVGNMYVCSLCLNFPFVFWKYQPITAILLHQSFLISW